MTLRVLTASLFGLGLLAVSPAASANDSDGDGVPDTSDAFPCDSNRVSRTYYPSQGQSALLTYEDEHPFPIDGDFNDVTLRMHMYYDQNASGRVVELRGAIDPVALGGLYDNGFGLQVPFDRVGTTIEMNVGGAGWNSVALESTETKATAILFENLRTLYGGQGGVINADPALTSLTAPRIEIRITPGVQSDSFGTNIPVDFFIFRSGSNPRHEIHFPEYPGTSQMDQSKLNVGDDDSSAGRMFVNRAGLPYALNLQTTLLYPREGVAIDAVFPDITNFAATGGLQSTNFYGASNIVQSEGLSALVDPLPAEDPVDTNCRSLTYMGMLPGNIIPELSGDTGSSNVRDPDYGFNVSASSVHRNGHSAYHAFSTDLSGNGFSIWHVSTKLSPGDFEFLKIELPKARAVGGFAWVNRQKDGLLKQMPAEFIFEGSNDDATWRQLGAWSGLEMSDYSDGIYKQFAVANTSTYRFYRWVFTKSVDENHGWLSVRDIQMYEALIDDPSVDEPQYGGVAPISIAPTLSSNSDQGYQLSSSSYYTAHQNYEWRAFSTTSNGGGYSMWHNDFVTDLAQTPQWLQIQLPAARTLGAFSFRNRRQSTDPNVPTDLEQMPSAFEFQGSNDGVTWTRLGKWKDLGYEDYNTQMDKVFAVENVRPYTTYRWVFTKSVAAHEAPTTYANRYISISNIELYEALVLPSSGPHSGFFPVAPNPRVPASINSHSYTQSRFGVSQTWRASSNSEHPGGGFAYHAFDNSVGSLWHSATPISNASSAVYLGIALPVAMPLGAFSLQSRADIEPGQMPGDFTVKASNDGVSWTMLESYSGLTTDSYLPKSSPRAFFVGSTSSYTHYRFEFTENSTRNGDWVSLASVRLFETVQ